MVSSSTVSGEGAYLLVDARRRIRRVSSGAAALLGIAPEAWVGAAWSPEECLRGRELASAEEPLRGRASRDDLSLVLLRPTPPSQGSLSAWRDSAELALLRDAAGGVAEVNHAFARKFAVPVPEWLGREVVPLIHPEDLPAWRDAQERLRRPPFRLAHETFPRTIEFDYRLDETLPNLSAHQNQLQQVVLNLCVNARDVMPGGGRLTLITGRVRGDQLARLRADPRMDYVMIRISDTGCGMPEPVRARMFEPFFTTKQDSGGTGLGLSVVYGVVAHHRGVIDVESEEGAGTTFSVFLPLGGRESAAGTSDGAGVAEIPAGTESILVIEDEVALRTLLRVSLEMKGYRVRTVADGAEALDLLLGNPGPIDAVLLDLNLPRVSGLEVYPTVRRLLPRAPVLILSGNVSAAARAELEDVGQPVFLPKPCRLGNLGHQLRRALDGRTGGRSPVAASTSA